MQRQTRALVSCVRCVLVAGFLHINTRPSHCLQVDASRLRQVPDNQEVFIASSGADTSLIIELLDREVDTRDENAAEYFFRDLADTNEAAEGATILFCEQLTSEQVPGVLASSDAHTAGAYAAGLLGLQSVVKFRGKAAAAHTVQIYLAVIRLPAVGTDLLVTLNVPISATPIAVPGAEVAARASPFAPASSGTASGVGAGIASVSLLDCDQGEDWGFVFMQVLKALAVVDWGLFGT